MEGRHYLFFDCETGGLDPDKHTLLTAYFGVYNQDFNLIDELDLQLKPEDESKIVTQPKAMEITGIDLIEHLKDPQTLTYAEGAKKLVELFERNKIPKKRKFFTPCGQNIDFDLPFVKKQLIEPSSWEMYVHHNTLDTLRILSFLKDIGFVPKELGTLESLVNYFGIPMGQAHNAREDIRMTVEVYKAMRNLFISQKMKFSGASNSSLLEIIEE